MNAALDKFPCKKFKLLEPKAANCKSTAYYYIAKLKLIQEKSIFICKKEVLLAVLDTSTEMEYPGFSWVTCEILKYNPTTKLINEENSPEGIAEATAGP